MNISSQSELNSLTYLLPILKSLAYFLLFTLEKVTSLNNLSDIFFQVKLMSPRESILSLKWFIIYVI